MADIVKLDEGDGPALDRFLDSVDTDTTFYRRRWLRVLEETYGHQVDYWVARDAGAVVGAFPVVTVRLPLVRAKMIAGPYQFHSGAPIGTEAVSRALLEKAVDDFSSSGAAYFEVRHHSDLPFLEGAGFRAIDSGVVVTSVPLATFGEKTIIEGHRKEVRQALRRGVVVQEDHSDAALQEFRRLYAAEGRRLAGPRAGERFFRSLYTHMNEHCHLYVARVRGEFIGGLLTIGDARRDFARCSAYASEAALRLRVGKALLWHAMRCATDRGCEFFDLGISWWGDRGLIAFKEGWGGTSRVVHTYVRAVAGTTPTAGSYFEGFRVAKAIWRHLPMSVVDWLGHQITRWVC